MSGKHKKTIVIIGLMGSGKTHVGRLLSRRMGLSFADSDHEIEKAAGYSVTEMFERFGEESFREGERKVIQRLLEDGKPKVLSTGGGAFIQPQTRALIKELGVSVWLRADLDLLVERTAGSQNRPLLLKGEPRAILKELMDKRYPVYAQADITVDSQAIPPEDMAEKVENALKDYGYGQ